MNLCVQGLKFYLTAVAGTSATSTATTVTRDIIANAASSCVIP